MTFEYLDKVTLGLVRAAVQALSLNSDSNLDAMASGINPAFVGSAMVGSNPNAKLLTFSERLNSTRNLVSGQVPLEIWLSNGIVLAGGRQEELVFRDALALMSTDGHVSMAPTEGLTATPHSGGGLEIAINGDDTLGVGFLLRGAEAARSVAKLRVHRHFNGQPAFGIGGQPDWGLGTGWLIGPRLMMTNHHVVAARAPTEAPVDQVDFELQGKHSQAIFDFHDDNLVGVSVRSLSCVAADRTLDYAILRLEPSDPERPGLRLRTNPLTRPTGSALRERVNVLQHPGGNAMRLGFRNNFVVTGSSERLSYLTDTAGGSSGSPICDDLWFVAGLHRGWATIKGDPVKVWDKEIRQENYATPLGLILADIAAKDSPLLAEIDAGRVH